MIVDGSMGRGGDGVFYGVVNDTVGGDGVGVCFNGGGVCIRFVDPTMAGSREGVCLRVVGGTESGVGVRVYIRVVGVCIRVFNVIWVKHYFWM